MQKNMNQQEFSTAQKELLSDLWIKNSDFSVKSWFMILFTENLL